ncbi:chemotaxis protein CheW [Motiliproteus sp. MSK22-1]|uniref:chemotaxis protein CheW n=1 Tax=Motiliproteus sp. MSK22-1 TaxID=1897630 RepID=UPI0009788F36|nr:chemotaxis protein CheW [Motiliproteus sp. MSK22-1]OMH30058.1 hypothetical protein BGP75_19195 [Motiliproteus sp. MSK22-1]
MNNDRLREKTLSKARTLTIAPQQAVQEYLDSLLQDATALAQVETEVTVATEVETAVTPAPANHTAVVETVTSVEPAPVTDVVETLERQTVTKTVDVATMDTVSAAVEPVSPSKDWVNGRPQWAQEKFECLLFKVAGLTLAVPLKELGGVLTMDEDLTPLFGQPDWFLGLLPSKTAGTVKTIDTARWVMPEKYTSAAGENLRYVILMEGTDWGMACHEVAEAISLTPDQVRWRSDRGLRPWLAGTVVEHMCAIMDVSALVTLVNEDSSKVKAPRWTKKQRSG